MVYHDNSSAATVYQDGAQQQLLFELPAYAEKSPRVLVLLNVSQDVIYLSYGMACELDGCSSVHYYRVPSLRRLFTRKGEGGSSMREFDIITRELVSRQVTTSKGRKSAMVPIELVKIRLCMAKDAETYCTMFVRLPWSQFNTKAARYASSKLLIWKGLIHGRHYSDDDDDVHE